MIRLLITEKTAQLIALRKANPSPAVLGRPKIFKRPALAITTSSAPPNAARKPTHCHVPKCFTQKAPGEQGNKRRDERDHPTCIAGRGQGQANRLNAQVKRYADKTEQRQLAQQAPARDAGPLVPPLEQDE